MDSDALKVSVHTDGEILSVSLAGEAWSGKVEHYDGGILVGIEADRARVMQALYAVMDQLPAHISPDLYATARLVERHLPTSPAVWLCNRLETQPTCDMRTPSGPERLKASLLADALRHSKVGLQ